MGLTLTVLFDDPFWVGLFERTTPDHLEVARVVFGAEPSDALVWQFVCERYHSVVFAAVSIAPGRPDAVRRNPKRRQREAARALAARGMSTRSQLALKMAQEDRKAAARDDRRRARADEAERRFALRQARRKARHRGH